MMRRQRVTRHAKEKERGHQDVIRGEEKRRENEGGSIKGGKEGRKEEAKKI